MLKDGPIALRALKKSDAQLLYKWRNELKYIKYTKSMRLPKHEGLEEEWVSNIMLDKSNQTVFFIIEINDISIGLVQLSQIDWISKNAFMGIAICEPDYKGKGHSIPSLKLMLDYAFKQLNLHKISVEIIEFNLNSIDIFTRLGFKSEGVMKEQYFWDDQYHDLHLYGILKAAYYL